MSVKTKFRTVTVNTKLTTWELCSRCCVFAIANISINLWLKVTAETVSEYFSASICGTNIFWLFNRNILFLALWVVSIDIWCIWTSSTSLSSCYWCMYFGVNQDIDDLGMYRFNNKIPLLKLSILSYNWPFMWSHLVLTVPPFISSFIRQYNDGTSVEASCICPPVLDCQVKLI